MQTQRRTFRYTGKILLGRLPIVALLCAAMAASAAAQGNPAAGKQCGDYAEAYKGGASGYGPYLDQTGEIAKARDTLEGGRRYAKSLQTSSAPSNALWLNNWCTKNPLRPFSEAANRLLEELTGQTPAAAAPPAAGYPAQPTQIVVMTPPPPPEPSACRVGDVGQCRGCSVTCGNGSQAKCKPGSTFAGPEQNCAFQAKCECALDRNATPAASGVSSCRIGDVGACSGCSVTCNNGQTPMCKPGSEFAGGGCAFQAKCSCK